MIRWFGDEPMESKTLRVTTMADYPVEELRAKSGQAGLLLDVIKVGPECFELRVRPLTRGFSGSIKLEADL